MESLNGCVPGARLGKALAMAALVGLLCVYAVQAATPLRLTFDSIGYLSIAHSIATGHGIPAHAPFPPGLPGLYALLAVLGIGRSWAIVMLNVVFLAVAMASTVVLYRRTLGIERQVSILLACSALLSYVVVKFAALALSDVPFLGVSSAALVLLTLAAQGRSNRRFVLLAVGIALVGAATAIRSAGIALAPAAFVASIETVRLGTPLRAWLRTGRAAVTLVVCTAATALLGYLLSSSRYFQTASVGYGHRSFGSLVARHIRNWGEIAVNVPKTRLPHALDALLVPAGLVVVGVLLVGVWRSRRSGLPVHVFTLSYLALILAWPYTDARFWLPLVPLTLGYAYIALKPVLRYRTGVIALGVYVIVFAGIGFVALEYNTSLSYSGSRFPDRYGGATPGVSLQPTYRVAFGEARPGDGARVNHNALAILRDWETRARHTHRP
jgi:hypothetical protein